MHPSLHVKKAGAFILLLFPPNAGEQIFSFGEEFQVLGGKKNLKRNRKKKKRKKKKNEMK